MADEAYVPRTSKDEDESHRLDAERTAWESGREHDSGTGSPQAKGETTGEPQTATHAPQTPTTETATQTPDQPPPTGDQPTTPDQPHTPPSE
jgi:hypothetical protein